MAIQAWQELMRVRRPKPRKPRRVYGLPVKYVDGPVLTHIEKCKINCPLGFERKVMGKTMVFLPAPKKIKQGTEA